MSVMVRTRAIDVLDNVFIFYDFQQIRDAIMIVAFVEDLGKWEKIFIYFIDGRWEIETLNEYFNDSKASWISDKIGMILQHQEDSGEFGGIDIEKDMKMDAVFMLGINKVD